MRSITSLAIAVLVCAALLHPPAGVDAQTLNYNKFPFNKKISKLGAYLGQSTSIKKIYGWADQGQWQQAFNQYSKVQVYDNPFRSLQTFAQGGTSGKFWKGEDTHDLFANYYGSAKYIENFINRYYKKNAELYKVGIEWIMWAFIANQIDEAKLYISKPELGHVDWGKGEMDDTAALYIGLKGGVNAWSIHQSTVKTGTKCTSLNKDVMSLLVTMRNQGNANVGKAISVWTGKGSWGENREKVYAIKVITQTRRIWTAVGNKKQALASAYLSTILPHLAAQDSAKKLQALLDAKTGTKTAVKPLLTDILSKQPWIGAGRIGEVYCDKL